MNKFNNFNKFNTANRYIECPLAVNYGHQGAVFTLVTKRHVGNSSGDIQGPEGREEDFLLLCLINPLQQQ